MYGEGLRASLYEDNIGVTVVCPGFVQSDMTDYLKKVKVPLQMYGITSNKVCVCVLNFSPPTHADPSCEGRRVAPPINPSFLSSWWHEPCFHVLLLLHSSVHNVGCLQIDAGGDRAK